MDTDTQQLEENWKGILDFCRQNFLDSPSLCTSVKLQFLFSVPLPALLASRAAVSVHVLTPLLPLHGEPTHLPSLSTFSLSALLTWRPVSKNQKKKDNQEIANIIPKCYAMYRRFLYQFITDFFFLFRYLFTVFMQNITIKTTGSLIKR